MLKLAEKMLTTGLQSQTSRLVWNRCTSCATTIAQSDKKLLQK